MSITQHNSAQTYRNVMDSLVAEEVEKQFQRLPTKVTSYVNKAEVTAYALNRLPALYATSQKGWEQQRIRARKELDSQIVAAVRQAIAAVQRDPLRAAAPLPIGTDQESQHVLQELKRLLGQDDLSWRNLAESVENALVRAARAGGNWRNQGSAAEHTAARQHNAAGQRNAWQDSRYYL